MSQNNEGGLFDSHDLLRLDLLSFTLRHDGSAK